MNKSVFFISMICWACTFPSVSDSAVIFRDDFNGTSVSGSWSIEHNDAGYYSVSGGLLSLRANQGDIYAARTDYKNVFRLPAPVTGDYTVTLKIQQFVPASVAYAQVALLIYDDSNNYLRNYYAYGGVLHRGAGQEINGSWSAQTGAVNFGSTPFYFQYEKTGNSYQTLYSTDGVNFTALFNPVTFGDGTPTYLGFVAMVDSTESSIAYIDYFEVSDDSPEPVPVPEPLTIISLGIGVAAVLRTRRG
ncbi:MAG: PEP-CTERM sorting domain-containing protein [Candidatus Auribacterota bacterium]